MYSGLNCFPNLETVMGIEIEREKLVVILEIHILIGSLVYSSTFKVDLSLHAPLAQKYPPLGQVWDWACQQGGTFSRLFTSFGT